MQLFDDAATLVDQVATVLAQAGQFTGQLGVRLQRAELIAVQTDVLFEQHGVGAVVFGATDAKGCAIVFQGLGVNRKEHDEIVRQEGGDHRAPRSFQGDGYGTVAKALPQFLAEAGGRGAAALYAKHPLPISQATIDDKVRRILRVAADFGWLDRPQLDTNIPRYNLEGRAASLQAAIEGAVLLKNDNNALPLDRKAIKTIAVIGPTAAQTVTTGGGSGEVVSFASTNLLVGVSNYLGEQAKVLYARGLYSVFQMARLTHFTTDPEGATAGVTHVTTSV